MLGNVRRSNVILYSLFAISMHRLKIHMCPRVTKGSSGLTWGIVTALCLIAGVVFVVFFRRPTVSNRNRIHISARMIDLLPYYNVQTTTSPFDWVTENGSGHLAEFPTGSTKFAGIPFRTEGIIQLAGKHSEIGNNRFPDKVQQIKVGDLCHEIHILHGTGLLAPDGAAIAILLVHYENGEERKIPIVYGRHVRTLWQSRPEPPPDAGSQIAWRGKNQVSPKNKARLHIYQSTFQNPLPDVTVESIDYVSTLTTCAPFLLALSIE